MLGRQYYCDRCDLEFCSGWSHHAGGQLLICNQCATYFVLGGGESPWDPRSGETLTLFRRDENGNSQTPFRTQVTLIERCDEWDGIIRIELQENRCPVCNATQSLMQELAIGAKCPRCGDGSVTDGGECIY
jgi:hypothetical protein